MTIMKLEYNIPQLGRISADLLGKSIACYEFLYEKNYIKKIQLMDQLGVIQNTPFKTNHKRMEYVVLQIYLVNLLLGRDLELGQFKNQKKKYNLGLSKEEQINSYSVTGAEIIIIWILLFNSGHLNGTFAAEKGLLKYIKEDNAFYNKIEKYMPEEIKNDFKDCILNNDTYNFHKFLIIFSLNIHYKQTRKEKTKRFIKLLIKLIHIYFNSTNYRHLKFKKIFSKIRQVSYLYLDSQYAEFPITFKITPLLLNLDNFIENLFDENSFFNKTLNSLDKLIFHDLYYSKESISEFNYCVDNFYEIWKNRNVSVNELKNIIISGDNVSIKKHEPPECLHLSIENSIKSEKWYLNKFNMDLENYLNNSPRENCKVTVENIVKLNFIIINMIFVSGNCYNHLISVSKLTKNLVKIKNEMINENNLSNESINELHTEFSDSFKEIILFILNKLIKTHYFIFDDSYENIQIISPHRKENIDYVFDNYVEKISDKNKKAEKILIKKFAKELFYTNSVMLISLSAIKGHLKKNDKLNVEIDGLIFMYKKQKLHLYLIESKNKKKRAHNDAKDDLDIKLDKLGLDDKLNEIKQGYNPKGIYYHLVI